MKAKHEWAEGPRIRGGTVRGDGGRRDGVLLFVPKAPHNVGRLMLLLGWGRYAWCGVSMAVLDDVGADLLRAAVDGMALKLGLVP